jgi:hypothetical protein
LGNSDNPGRHGFADGAACAGRSEGLQGKRPDGIAACADGGSRIESEKNQDLLRRILTNIAGCAENRNEIERFVGDDGVIAAKCPFMGVRRGR